MPEYTRSLWSNMQQLECIIFRSCGLLCRPAINRLSAPLLPSLQPGEKREQSFKARLLNYLSVGYLRVHWTLTVHLK